ncbi:SIMPL domain-containing protein [Microcella sp.]|uniref:SIMPL domain-containing protein n=1 Tax=Microcella sp. TaxID=1913979 RepID=UPI0025605E9B|nr:SIMPL domain-containing protein [Microcella sp.]MBX9471248.1 SIMPL domain-containing protein [Microcella sp.]
MSETVITVQGSARSEMPPEQAVLRFTVTADGPERVPVVAAVTAALNDVSSVLSAQHANDGPVSQWSADRVAVTSHRPWTNDGVPAALVHQATASGRATISRIDAVAELIDDLASHDLVAIDSLEWSLTDARLAREQRDVRARAVADARAKAEVLAESVGLGSVTPLALADPGMLDGSGGGGMPMPRVERAMAMASMPHGDVGFSLRPEPIVINVAVDARFSAR